MNFKFELQQVSYNVISFAQANDITLYEKR